MISITCPSGFGKTDRNRCMDQVSCLLPSLTCLRCPIPVVLVAAEGDDICNRALAARLPGLISSPWTPPKQFLRPVKNLKRLLPRHRALALALVAAITASPRGEITERIMESRYLAVKNAPPLRNRGDMMRIIRAAGLPVQRKSKNQLVIPVNDHVRAFVRAYLGEAA